VLWVKGTPGTIRFGGEEELSKVVDVREEMRSIYIFTIIIIYSGDGGSGERHVKYCTWTGLLFYYIYIIILLLQRRWARPRRAHLPRLD
jgi:hypothetical protein